MSEPARTWRQWARDEFLWPGPLVVFAVLAWCFWFGITHRTWVGGFVFATGGAVFNRNMERTIESWRAWRREARRG